GGTPDLEGLGTPGETVVSFPGADKARLGGTIALPETAPGSRAGVPGIVIVPDIGAVDREGAIASIPDPLYRDLSQTFNKAGMAALRYDRRGIGSSQAPAGQATTFDGMVADARAAVDFMASRRGIEADGLALVGHDRGGLIALRVAATDPRVKAVVLVSTPGRPLVGVMGDEVRAAFGDASATALRAALGTYLATGAMPDRASTRPELQQMLSPANEGMLKVLLGLDPVAEARAVKVPAFIATGAQSERVRGIDADNLARALGGAETAVADGGETLRKLGTVASATVTAADENSHSGGSSIIPPSLRDETVMGRMAGFLAGRLGARRL
ncbi:MAG: alpha/beta hydrolase, partial [Acidimicrobiales bacterium]